MTRNSFHYTAVSATLFLASACAQAVPPVPPVPATPPAPEMRQIWIGTGGSFLGIGVAEVTADRARALNLREEYGVEVTRVDEGSPAAKAGLQSSDVILSYNGQRVEGIEQLQRMIRETPSGRAAKLTISRNGTQQTLTATIASRKAHAYMDKDAGDLFGPNGIQIPAIPVMPDMPNVTMSLRSQMLGVETESLGAQLGDYFGVHEGVLVRAVVKGSAAEKAGIKAGDVIVAVNNNKIASSGELSSAVRAAHGAASVPVELVRERKHMSVTANLEGQNNVPARSTAHVRPI